MYTYIQDLRMSQVCPLIINVSRIWPGSEETSTVPLHLLCAYIYGEPALQPKIPECSHRIWVSFSEFIAMMFESSVMTFFLRSSRSVLNSFSHAVTGTSPPSRGLEASHGILTYWDIIVGYRWCIPDGLIMDEWNVLIVEGKPLC